MPDSSDSAKQGDLTRAPAPGRPFALLALVACLATALGYAWTLDGWFVGDDFGFIGRYFDFSFTEWPRLFVYGWTEDLWDTTPRELRPLNALAFMVDAQVWGLDPFGFRLTNLGFHAVAATLVGLLAWRATRGDTFSSAVATILFALHPVHAGAVSWITGRVDPLATAFYLGGVLAFLRHRETPHGKWLLALTGCHLGAIFTKELGLTLPAMLLVADAMANGRLRRWRERETWLPYACCLVVSVLYFLCRRAAFEVSGVGGIGTGVPDPLSGNFYANLLHRQRAYLAHLFPPLEPWAMDWIAGGKSLTARHFIRLGVLLLGTGLAAFAFHRWRKSTADAPAQRRTAAFFGPGWYLVATLPLMMTYPSPRHLYLAAAGLAIGAVLLLRGALASRPVFGVVASLLALFLGQQLIQTLRPWHDAALLSRTVTKEVALAAADAPPGSALLIDVPAFAGRAFCWSWAIPHAVRPPFQSDRLDERITILGSPNTYALTSRWREQPAIVALSRIAPQCWLIQVTDTGVVRRIAISPEKLRRAAERLANPASTPAPDAAWRHFIAELSPR